MSNTEEMFIEIGKDILIALVLVMIILGSLYAFSGRWPPMVVIETGSMMHSEESQIGTIDPGDIVIVQETEREDITTYVEGRNEDYSKYGQYGDVIVFDRDGDGEETPIIHRALLYLKENETNDSFDVPSLAHLEYGTDWSIDAGEDEQLSDGRNLTGTLKIYDYGFEDKELSIDLDNLGTSGFITKGDANPNIDQKPGGYQPIEEDWIIGKSRGELPWFGIIKLAIMGRTEEVPSNSWRNFIISIAVLLMIPLFMELANTIHDKVWGTEDKSEDKTTFKNAHWDEENKIYKENDDKDPPQNTIKAYAQKDVESDPTKSNENKYEEKESSASETNRGGRDI